MTSAPTLRRRAFTLVELLMVVAILGALAAILLPALFGALQVADRTACASNLRQLGLAVQMYLKDNQGVFFPIRFAPDASTPEDEARLWYFGYEEGTSWQSDAEGTRRLDKTRALLYRYAEAYENIEVCPSFNYFGPYKAKFRTKWWTYGVNKVLCPDLYVSRSEPCRGMAEIRPADAPRTVLMADAAQVNTFQPPASPVNPLVEEWHYVQPASARQRDWPHVHFRHRGEANVLMADGHVETRGPLAGSIDQRLPSARIGHLDETEVLFYPRAGGGR